MRLPPLRTTLPWLIGVSLIISLACIAFAARQAQTARDRAIENATRQMATQADTVSREIEADLALFDLALREAARPRDSGQAGAKASFPELPLTARYVGFMNVLNEVGDVVADSRSNVSRPVNFAGRDYFQDHLKNPADVVMIGRPFATAPTQHASIPISRRLSQPNGGFGGVVVAGVHLAWLGDVLSHVSAGPHTITIRRDDGLILTREPFDADTIGRNGATDPAWRTWLRSGGSPITDDTGEIRLFRRVGEAPLVLEMAVASADIAQDEWSSLVSLPLLVLVPGLCAAGLGLLAHRLSCRGDQIEAAARAANDERMHLLATMSHELRTPLTGIMGQAELMTDEGGLNDRQLTRLTRLTEAGTLMRAIVNRVIDLASPEDRAATAIPIACELDPLIRTCLGIVEGEARRKGLRLISGIDLSTPRQVMLARDLVQQVLVNLLMNAVKFTAQGTVVLRVAGDAGQLRFEIADTGSGIPTNRRGRLFRAYDRLDASASRTEGTGLGLSITERFVSQMGGRLGHAENPGGGSVFWVELPIELAQPMNPAGRVAPEEPPKPNISHLCLLLADDLDLTRAVTADYLRSAGHAVTEVPDGETAVAEVRKHNFDAVLTDMRMPVVDGLEVTRRIRALPGHRGRTPVILVTADLVALGQGASGQTGVDVCLMKPFTRAELLAAVATAARITPVPEVAPSDSPVLDASVLTDLRASVGDKAFATHLGSAARRIEALLVLLESPDVQENPTARNAIHDLVGVSGLLGLTALSSCLRRFDTARDREVHTLREAANIALLTLRRFQTTGASNMTSQVS